MIEVKGLSVTLRKGKRQEPFCISQINFSLEQGYFMGLLGGNGSGKSTLLRMLGGVMAPDEGGVCILREHDAAMLYLPHDISYKNEVALVEAEAGVFQYGTIAEHIRRQELFFPRFDKALFDEYFMRLDCSSCDLHNVVAHMSIGEQMKLKLACALARTPKLLLLDEPTANLDPVARVKLMELVKEQLGRGTSVIMSSHILSDMEDIMDYIGVMEQGNMIWFSDCEAYAKAKEEGKVI